MNKVFQILMAFAAAAVLWSCEKEPEENKVPDGGTEGQEVEKPVVYADNEVIAKLGGGLTKTVNDESGIYKWAEKDSISVYTTRGHFVTYHLVEGAGTTEGKFKAELREGEKPLAFASYPVGTAHYEMDRLSVVMPSSYKVNDGINQVPMMAQFEEGANEFVFSPLTGVLIVTMDGIPAEAATFQFKTEDKMKMTGIFDYEEGGIVTSEGREKDVVTVDFTPGQTSRMSYAIPLPSGTYSRFTVGFKDSEGVLLSSTVRTSGNVEITNATVKTLAEFNSSLNIIYVKPGADGFGSSWEDASSLSAALETAPDGAIIKVAAGTYKPENILPGQLSNSDSYKTFHVGANVTIQGGYPAEGGADEQIDSANVTILSGQVSESSNSFHVMTVAAPASDVAVKLRGLTFTGGSASSAETSTTTPDNIKVVDNYGGGLVVASTAEIEGCTFLSNNADASEGGGLFVVGGVKANLKNCGFFMNHADNGGAISTGGDADVNIDRCMFSQNTAKYGGAIKTNADSETMITNSSFVENSVTGGWGGAIRNFAVMTIENSEFIGNDATFTGKDSGGGAIQNNRSILKVKDCVFENNHAVNGAAITNFGEGETEATGCSFISNVATPHSASATSAGYGGAVYNFFNKNQGTFRLTDCRFTGNEALYGGAAGNQVGIMVIDGCVFESNTATNNGGAVLAFGADISSHKELAADKLAYTYIYNTLFLNNVNTSTSGQGGAIKVHGNANLVAVNSTFTGNEAANGIIRLRIGSVPVTAWLVSCTFSGNTKYSLYNQSSEAFIYNSVMDDPSSYNANQTTGSVTIGDSFLYNTSYYLIGEGYLAGKAAVSTIEDKTELAGTVVGEFDNEDGVFAVSGDALKKGMSSEELSDLATGITAGMPLFDAAKLTVDQNGNSRVGKAVMGASVK